MTRLFSMFTHNRVKELIRCEVPETLSLDKKQRLLEGIVNLQMALVEAAPVFIELMYNGQIWKFGLNNTHALSFNSECLWVPDNAKGTLIPFNLHYITEIYCTTVSQ